MMFLSPLTLLLGLAAIVPLVLHLRQRQKRVVIHYSSNRFFTQAVLKTQKRLRFHRILLLLLRILACLLLAAALARPILDLAGIGAADAGRRDVVVLLDDSLSMTAKPSNATQAKSNFDRAKQMVAATLEQLASGDRAAVLTFTGRAVAPAGQEDVELSSQPISLAQQVRDLSPSLAAGDAHAAIKRAANLLAASPQRARVLMLVTDTQAADWRQTNWPQPQGKIPAMLAKLDPPSNENLSIEDFSPAQASQVVGQPGLLRARIYNHQPKNISAELVLTIDGKEITRKTVELSGQSSRTEQLPVIYDTPGEHRIQLQLTSPDALPLDNDFYSTVMVHDRLPVLIVDGQGSSNPRQSAAFFLRAALLAASEGAAIQPDMVKPDEFLATRLEAYRVILLTEVSKMTLPQVERLEQFVRDGGGLAIIPGDGADLPFYNELLGASSRPLQGLMPMQLHAVVGSVGAATPMHILDAELDHPVLQRFKGTLRGTLASVNIYQAYGVTPDAVQSQVIASMENGYPLIAERAYGRGRVLLLTSPPQPRWTNLPLRRVFIPLMTRMVGYLAAGESVDASHEVGRELMLVRGGWDYDKPVQIVRPDGQRIVASVRTLGPEPVAFLPGSVASIPGFYQVQWPNEQTSKTLPASAPSPSGKSNTLRNLVAMNVPRSESQTRTIDLNEAVKQAGNWNLTVVDLSNQSHNETNSPAPDLFAMLDQNRAGRGVWDTLLWIALIVLLIEPIVANWFRGSLSSSMHKKTETKITIGGQA